MTITEQKAAQRKAGIAARRALSDTERTHSNAALCARIMALDCFKKAENILLYAAFGGEADLSTLAVEAARQGKMLAYPVCGEGFSLTAAVPGPDGWEVGTLRHPHTHFEPVCRFCHRTSSTSCWSPARLLMQSVTGWGWGKAIMTATSPAAPGL